MLIVSIITCKVNIINHQNGSVEIHAKQNHIIHLLRNLLYLIRLYKGVFIKMLTVIIIQKYCTVMLLEVPLSALKKKKKITELLLLQTIKLSIAKANAVQYMKT